MSDAVYQRERLAAAPPALAARFFGEPDAWWRLNPEWEVLAHEPGRLRVRYERSEAEEEWRIRPSKFSDDGGVVVLEGAHPRRIELSWRALPAGGTALGYREAFDAPIEDARRAELNLWLDAAAGYLALAARRDRRARLGKWLLDKAWLRMSPTSRRVGLIIVAMEALALLLFIAVVIVVRFVG